MLILPYALTKDQLQETQLLRAQSKSYTELVDSRHLVDLHLPTPEGGTDYCNQILHI